jgi:hypothetical protein
LIEPGMRLFERRRGGRFLGLGFGDLLATRACVQHAQALASLQKLRCRYLEVALGFKNTSAGYCTFL